MSIRQLSIFIENKPGRIAQVTEVIAKAKVDIRGLSIADTSDFGILRLIVDDPDKALDALKKANMTVSVTSVIAVGIDDKPGEFSKVMNILANEGIGIEYMYAFISRDKNKAFAILRMEEEEKASKILIKNNIEILKPEQIHGM